jgi:hypothetical protein
MEASASSRALPCALRISSVGMPPRMCEGWKPSLFQRICPRVAG